MGWLHAGQVGASLIMRRTLTERPLGVPKQLGWVLDLGFVRFSPAVMVLRRPWLSVAGCRRCHAVRHSSAVLTARTEYLRVRWLIE